MDHRIEQLINFFALYIAYTSRLNSSSTRSFWTTILCFSTSDNKNEQNQSKKHCNKTISGYQYFFVYILVHLKHSIKHSDKSPTKKSIRGYISVGDGCWWRFILVLTSRSICLWPILHIFLNCHQYLLHVENENFNVLTFDFLWILNNSCM